MANSLHCAHRTFTFSGPPNKLAILESLVIDVDQLLVRVHHGQHVFRILSGSQGRAGPRTPMCERVTILSAGGQLQRGTLAVMWKFTGSARRPRAADRAWMSG